VSAPRGRIIATATAAFMLIVLAATPAHAAPGDIDPTFGGGDGIVGIDRGDTDAGQKVLVLPNGKFLLAGQGGNFPDTDLLLARFTKDGEPDATFGGGDGVVTVDFFGGFDDMFGLNRMPDGRIVVAGHAQDAHDTSDRVAVARFKPNGLLDHSFSGDGKATAAIPGLGFSAAWRSLVQPNGKVVLVGNAEPEPGEPGDLIAVRLNVDGTFDSGFNGDGRFVLDLGGDDGAWDVRTLPNGDLLAVGWSNLTDEGRIALVWLTPSGHLDPGEGGGDGRTLIDLVPNNATEFARAVFVLPSGKLLIVGNADRAVRPKSKGDVFEARLKANGLRDTSFGGGDGWVACDGGGSDELVLGARRGTDGSMVVAGTSDLGFFVARLKPNGAADHSFGTNGFAKTFPPSSRANDAVILGNGKILVATDVSHDAAAVRLLG